MKEIKELNELKQLKKCETVNLKPQKEIYDYALQVFNGIKNNSLPNLNHIKLITTIKRAEMLELAVENIKRLTNNHKIQPEEIIIVTPQIDESIKCTLMEFFELNNINFQFLSGSKKLIDNPLVFGSLIIAQLINDIWKMPPKPFEIRLLFTDLLGFPTVVCNEIINYYSKSGNLDENAEFKQGVSGTKMSLI